MKSDRLAEQHKIVRTKLEEFTKAINDKINSDDKLKVDLSNFLLSIYPKSKVPEFKTTFNALVANYNSSLSFVSKPPTSTNAVVALQRKAALKEIPLLHNNIEKIITECKNYLDEKSCNEVLESMENVKASAGLMQEEGSNNEKKSDSPPNLQL